MALGYGGAGLVQGFAAWAVCWFAVAPVGGTLMIAGWIVLAIAAFRSHNVNA